MVDCGLLGYDTMYSLTGGYEQFVGTCCLHLHTYHEDGGSRFSEELVIYEMLLCRDTEDHNLNFHIHENLFLYIRHFLHIAYV